ncbi:Exopolyphosphatase-related protein [Archaeoglobus sulfaticallidus PM70-1]|uniref:Exopolyphosphatase-related protein n=1 Tax=Archaeoglobus sulfaticallidus PM70-1 TaxID=387631 RepID=N0BBS6_9EURY|nr:DHH family phosphoesterase [Archaeoglobus sulfaticallidus]AGK61049.1 Exopolyphosphatase-related protein [Archaeoglobus sulfaticallidus PM70-1]
MTEISESESKTLVDKEGNKAENGDFDYLVIGCGSLGFNVLKELARRGKKALAVDSSQEKIEVLKDQDFNALIGDASNEDFLLSFDYDRISVVFILIPDFEVVKRAIKLIRNVSRSVFIIARASTGKEKEELEMLGADAVITPSYAMTRIAIETLDRIETLRRLKKFKEVLNSMKGSKLAIFTHDNPDPDALSSAMALKEIAKKLGVEADILYYGEISHQENKAMVNLLEIELVHAKDVDIYTYENFALVDSSAVGVNNSIPKDVKLNIVIDHHPAENVEADFVDIRDDVGSTATIMTNYMVEMNMVPSRMLATALFFGIKSETHEFKRNARTQDFSAAAMLYPYVDHDLIERMEGPALSYETLDVLGTAIKNREIYPPVLISFAGFISEKDAITQAADLLLKLEGISTVLVFGVVRDVIHLSARNVDVRMNIGEVLRKAFGDVGSAGGHAHAGGGQIPLGIFGEIGDKEILSKLIKEAIKRRFLQAIGIEGTSE